MKQKTIYIYHNCICQIGGVETFLYNWCLNLRNYYDITVLYSTGDARQIRRLRRLVKLEIYDKDKTYECDIFIRNSVWGEVPNNVISKDNRYLEMRHANYKFLLDKGKLYKQYHKMDKTNEVIGCGEFVSEMSNLVLKDNPTTIINILAPKIKTNKILKLISCTRIDPEKGWNRMLKLMSMLKQADIKFEWDIFTNSNVRCDYEEVHFYKQRFDIWDYLANADYTVLLSDSEGLPYTVQESLQYQTPCIVTDVGGCTELIKDGINGYVVPLDMNFDVKKILKIPKCSEYNNHALEKWLEYLGDGVYIEKEEENIMVECKTIKEFTLEDFDKLKNIKRIDKEEEGRLFVGDTFECDDKMADYLTGNNNAKQIVIEIIREIPEIKEVVKEEKEVKKPTRRKTTKRK